MPSNFTKNYQLSQWEKTDPVLMDDFNADNAKIDAALSGKIGKMEQVFMLESNGDNFRSSGFNAMPSEMKKYEYFAAVFEFPVRDEDINKTIELTFGSHTNHVTTFPAQPFILLFFPHHDTTNQFRCLLICEKPRYFVFDATFDEVTDYHLAVADNGNIVSPTLRLLGWK